MVFLVQRRECGLRAGREPPAVGETPGLLGERLGLARLELQGFELAHLVTQQLELRIAIARLALERECAVEELEPDAMCDPDLTDACVQRAVAIEQLALRGAAGEGLEFVLPVDIDEDAAGLAQHLHRDRLTIQISTRATVAADDAAHAELGGSAEGLFFEPLLELARRLGEIKGRGNLGALSAVA